MSTDHFESVFRYAWHLQFGRSPEAILGLTHVPACDLSTSHFEMDLDTMLAQFRAHLRAEGTRVGIDARAIAGAIAWEYRNNKLGRYTDYLQFTANRERASYRFGSGQPAFGQGLGWGSVHTDAAQGMRPGASLWDLQCQRMKADSAITLVADIMGRDVHSYWKLSDGVWIGDVPGVVALFFNAGEPLLRKSAQRVSARTSDDVTLVIHENPMAQWLHENLATFDEFRTPSPPPARTRVRVRVK